MNSPLIPALKRKKPTAFNLVAEAVDTLTKMERRDPHPDENGECGESFYILTESDHEAMLEDLQNAECIALDRGV